MIRPIALTLLCTSALATGVVVASPSLASAFRSQPPHAPRVHNLWDYSISGGSTAATTAARVTHHAKPAKRHQAYVPPVQSSAPAGTTTPTETTPTTEPTTTPPPTTSGSGSGSSDGTPQPALNPPFTLRGVDARCFYAPSSPGGWPFAPTSAVHPIRGSFDEPRSPVHIGVDVEAPREQAPVFAMQTGTVRNVKADHFDVVPRQGPRASYLQYWHVNLAPGIRAGSAVRRGQRIGHVMAHMLHVHISEYAAGCGLVDPARPTGLLHDPYNAEWPTIGPLSAVTGGPRAFVPLNVQLAPGMTELTDPARPVDLTALRGTVDLRAPVTDMPAVHMQHNPQMALAPAAIRAYLTPAATTHRHLTMHTIFDGSRLLPAAPRLWHLWAFGTYRENGCYFTSTAPCGMQMVWHVGGPDGFDTTKVPNGSYRFCVEALTIAGVDARRCTPVTIAN